jgi:hypothetical protein
VKPVNDDTLAAIETAVEPSVAAIKAYLAYQGDNSQYRDKARIAVGLLSAFGRVRASETNRMQVELIGERIAAEHPRRLTRAK